LRKILPLTYDPKIQAVLEGRCCQTIRLGSRFAVGDEIMFHGWEGRPYYSKWSFRTPYLPLEEVINIEILPDGIRYIESGVVTPWADLDDLAARDGIVPPTGEALRDVLFGMHKISGPTPAQIIRWAGEPV
jgi:hypothetical protein